MGSRISFNLRRIRQISLGLASVFLLVPAVAQMGPLGQTPQRTTPRMGLPAAGNTVYSGASSTVATTTSMDVLDDSRKLGIGDQVSFRVVEDRDPPVPLVVTDSGEMEVPYIGRVKAVGRTCKALANSVKSALEVDYYFKATVIVALDAKGTGAIGRITVSGQVLNSGTQEISASEGLSASKAIANSGGITRFGDERRVRIIRQSVNGGAQIIIFDYKAFTQGKGEDVSLQPNDTVNVPARGIVF